MLKYAVLALKMKVRGKGDQYLAIPVVNFPVLPVGSIVSIFIGQTQVFDDAKIIRYKTSNEQGTEVLLAVGTDKLARAHWDELVKLSEPDPANHYDYAYPGVLDYGVPHPFIIKH